MKLEFFTLPSHFCNYLLLADVTGHIKCEQFLSACIFYLKQMFLFSLLLVGYAMVCAGWFILELELPKTDRCWYFFYKWTLISFLKTTT